MRILGAIVLAEPLLMRAQLVGYQQFRHKPLLSEKLAHQPQRRPAVAATLDQHVKDLAFVVDGTPEVHPLAGDPDNHLVQVPSNQRAGFSSCCHRSRVPSSQRIFHYVVAPSGSCVHRVRDNFDAIEQTAAARHPGVTGHRGRRSLGVVLSDITLTSRLSRATGQFPADLEPACCKRIEKADRRPPRYWATQKIEPGSRNRPVPRKGGDRRRHTYPTSR